MSFFYDWVRRMLNYLGLVDLNAKMLFLGLDNAGKTTLLGSLSRSRVMTCLPTIQPNQEELSLGGLNFKTFDLGGHKKARPLWKDYLVEVDVIVFVVDSSDTERLAEASEVFNGLLKMDSIASVPILVLGNKIDLRGAVSERELREALGIYHTTGKGSVAVDKNIRPIEVFMCSIANRQGYAEGFRWVAQYVEGK